MPIESFEIIKLIAGIFIISIPGYLWSFIFFKHLTRLERFVFGFILGLGVLTCMTFMLNVVFNIKITQIFVILLFVIYTIPAFILYGLSIYRSGLPKIDLTPIKNKKFIFLAAILVFTFFMMFLPHLSNNCFLPLHVDEWIHWSYSRTVMETGSTTFLNPYTGIENVVNMEIGFHIATSCISWLSGANLLSIFLFMPSIIGLFISLTAYNIGERSERKFGLEAAFLVGFIPTTIRFLGPSFYVAVTLGMLLLIFIIWIAQLKKRQGAVFMAGFIWFMFIVHPPTAFVGIIFMFIFSAFLALEKEYKTALLTSICSAIPIIPTIIVYYSTAGWNFYIERFIQAVYGEEYVLGLPVIWVDFEQLGLITWMLFVIGIYYSFTRGKSLKRSLSFSSIIFIIIIGLYDKLGYGIPIIYERTFLYLFLLVALTAAVGFSELRKSIKSIIEKNIFKNYRQFSKNLKFTLPAVVCTLLLITAVPAHLSIPYYQMIDEKEYETFIWIRDNVDDYRDENHSIDKAAVDLFKASPFSAITGLYIISSSMHPRYGYYFQDEVEQFFKERCMDTDFLEQHRSCIIYGNCENEFFKEIYENSYIYYGTPPKANFNYSPDTPSYNDTIYFTSNSTTPYGRIIRWKWDFGDGNKSSGETTGLKFDGIDDYVDCGNDSSLDFGTDDFTVELYFKCSNTTGFKTLISRGQYGDHEMEDHWWIYIRDNGTRLWMGVEKDGHIIVGGYDDNNWHHLVCVRDKNDSILYVDNTPYTQSGFYSGKNLTNDEYLWIGKRRDGYYFNGTVNTIRIYDHALNSTEIQNNCNGDITTNGLVSWWKMNETGNIAHDSIGSNDGTIHEARWVNHADHKYSHPGTYQVQLIAWNEDGLDHSVSKNITIS